MAATAEACKYTVRDVAFVTLREAPYRLDVTLPGSATDDQLRRVQAAAELALTEVNVVVHSTADDSHESQGSDTAAADAPAGAPRLVLSAPDERRLSIPWPEQNDADPADTLRTVCRRMVASPTQLKLRELLLAGHHSVIVLHEGDVAEHNQQARETVAGLIDEVERALPSLPKPIDLPPALLVVSQEQTPEERTFLWSLGIDLDQFEEAQLTIVFGRCRLLGPPMPVPGTTRSQILRRLAAVGQDCECELDRSVMRGQMILHEWTAREEAEAARMLGFDPGNPLVQVEIQRILSRGPVGNRPPAESIDLAVDDLSLGGLQIIDIGSFGAPENEGEQAAPNNQAAPNDQAAAQNDQMTPNEIAAAVDVVASEVAAPSAETEVTQAPAPPATSESAATPNSTTAITTTPAIRVALFWVVGVVAAVGLLGAGWILVRGGA